MSITKEKLKEDQNKKTKKGTKRLFVFLGIFISLPIIGLTAYSHNTALPYNEYEFTWKLNVNVPVERVRITDEGIWIWLAEGYRWFYGDDYYSVSEKEFFSYYCLNIYTDVTSMSEAYVIVSKVDLGKKICKIEHHLRIIEIHIPKEVWREN